MRLIGMSILWILRSQEMEQIREQNMKNEVIHKRVLRRVVPLKTVFVFFKGS